MHQCLVLDDEFVFLAIEMGFIVQNYIMIIKNSLLIETKSLCIWRNAKKDMVSYSVCYALVCLAG